MKRILMSAAVFAFLLTLVQPAAAQDLASQIVGVWKYMSVNNKEVATGKITYPFGEKPSGYIVYTKGGRLVSSLFGDNRKKPAGATATDAERVALFNTLAAVSGTYKLEGKTLRISYEASWHELWTGVTHERTISISGNKLTITSAPAKNLAGLEIVFELVLERAE